jgi:hypothetical protein
MRQHASFDVEATDSQGVVLDMMSNNSQMIVGDDDGPRSLFSFDERGKSLEMEKFMHEGVVIEIHTISEADTAAPAAYLSDNGDGRWLPRGVRIRIPRKFVEILARSREAHYSTAGESKDHEADNRLPVKVRTRPGYGYSVIEDKNPLGRAWLEAVRRQRA